MHPVYVTSTGQYLPGAPIGNDSKVDYIGRLSPEAERLGRLTLRQNRIRTRHYAIRPDGTSEWTVARLAAAALAQVMDKAEIDPGAIGLLATATTQNDMLVPGLACGVHAASGLGPIEIASLQSVCASSMMAWKAAALSDGAARLLLESRPAARGLSLRVDWMSLRSFADRFAPCMTGGVAREDDGSLTPWSHHATIGEAASRGAFQSRQDIGALHRMLPVWWGEFMRLVDAGRIDPAATDWFCCHYSAHSLREEMVALASRAGCLIPEERWFTNLYEKGNVGAASIFLMLDDLLASGRLEVGQTIVCAVPESGQCVMAYAGLTVVGAEAWTRQ